MNKEWFVFKGTHHLGPFSILEMEEFYRDNEMNDQTLIWKEGSEKWQPLSKTNEFQFLFKPEVKDKVVAENDEEYDDLPPPLPPLHTLPKIPTEALTHFSSAHVELFNDELPPPIPLDAIIDPKGEIRARARTDEASNTRKKYFLIFGVLIFATVLVWYSLTQREAAIQLRIK